MRNIMSILVFTLIVLNSIININYVFAFKRELLHSSGDKYIQQKSKQNIQCNINANCNNEAAQQQQTTRQNIQCDVNAKCNNYSNSNMVVCKERSVCLFQYDGPFRLANPY